MPACATFSIGRHRLDFVDRLASLFRQRDKTRKPFPHPLASASIVQREELLNERRVSLLVLRSMTLHVRQLLDHFVGSRAKGAGNLLQVEVEPANSIGITLAIRHEQDDGLRRLA